MHTCISMYLTLGNPFNRNVLLDSNKTWVSHRSPSVLAGLYVHCHPIVYIKSLVRAPMSL